MTHHLRIRSAGECQYDELSLGEVMLRLDPTPFPTARAFQCRIFMGGGETNVAVGLSYTFGFRTTVVTALVDDGVGKNIINQFNMHGVDTSKIILFNTNNEGRFSTDKKGTLHNGINFTFAGKGVLPAVTEYYRAHTPIRELQPGDIPWDTIFGQEGVRWFHTGGIYTLLSPSSAEVAEEAMQTARKHGTVVSFDLNYRSKVEPDKERARRINRKLMQYVDVVFGNQDDFEDALGYETEKVPQDASFDEWLAAYRNMLCQVAEDYPNLKYIGTQLRGALSADRINWSAILYEVDSGEIFCATPRENVEIIDRVGGGDSFAAGLAAAFLDGHDPKTAVEWGAAHGILVQECVGDTTMVTREQVIAEVKRVQKGGGVSALR
ncbi:MAG: sugar kinase [Lentisphaerae bacterium]|nr:MAG: sugar kinase [Lentisphaerota bacterium]